MRALTFIITIFSFIFVANLAYAGDVTLDMLNKRADGQKMVYSQDIVKVNVGDTVTWLTKSKGHNVHFIAVPDGIKKVKKSKLNKEYSYKFSKPGIYLYQCTPHKAMGMIALVVVGNNIDNKDLVAKTKVFGKSKKKLKKMLKEL